MTLFETRPVTVSIARPAAEVYAFAHRPEGDVRERFSPENPYGVLDHWVTLSDGTRLSIPLRVVTNGEGAEVTLTLFRAPGMDDATFVRDQDWVARDLAALKALLEQ
jgi:hypothetical protein